MNKKQEVVTPRGARCTPRTPGHLPRRPAAASAASRPCPGPLSHLLLSPPPAPGPPCARPGLAWTLSQPCSPGCSASTAQLPGRPRCCSGAHLALAKTPLGRDQGPAGLRGGRRGGPACLPPAPTPSLSAARRLVSWSGGSCRPRAGRSCASSDVTEGRPQVQGLSRVHPRNSWGASLTSPGLVNLARIGVPLARSCPCRALQDTGTL